MTKTGGEHFAVADRSGNKGVTRRCPLRADVKEVRCGGARGMAERAVVVRKKIGPEEGVGGPGTARKEEAEETLVVLPAVIGLRVPPQVVPNGAARANFIRYRGRPRRRVLGCISPGLVLPGSVRENLGGR